MATPSKSRFPTRASTSRSRSTARASGATRTPGSRGGAAAATRGRLVFLVNSALAILCAPDDADAPLGERLLRPYFGMHRIEWPDDASVEFHLPHGELIGLLRSSGFAIEELVEVRPPDGSTNAYHPGDSLEWAQKWPAEEVWKVRRR